MAKRGSLTHYRKKRDFNKTPEPKGTKAKKKRHLYLIQKHAASHLHYDFRLELDGVLKSWAIPRGPSLDPHDKRLAVEVEDHPVSYGSFEGIIPKGQYGGGTVMLWDTGTWEVIGDPHEGLAKGKLEFRLYGERLQGEWALVRMHSREKDKGRNNWLLIKHKDKIAREGKGDGLLNKHNTSVVSGRTMEKIASDSSSTWQSKAETRKKTKSKPLPGFIAPELATLVDTMPEGEEWVHEIKFDGYRILAYIQDGNVRMYTRTGQDWTHKFHPLADVLRKMPVQNAIIDGEVIALNDEGISSFTLLQEALSKGKTGELSYYVFDLLYLNGKNITHLPLLERKKKLKPLITAKLDGYVFYSEHFAKQDKHFLQHICHMHMEGVVSKRIDAAYTSKRSKSWVKTKCHQRQEFVIGGFTLPTHKERGIGALLLGYYEGKEFIYAGKLGTGFDQETAPLLRKKLDRLKQKTMAFAEVPSIVSNKAIWVKPTLVCEVEFTEWTADGRLRHPSFQGMRDDKPAKNISRDIPATIKKTKSKKTTMQANKDTEIAGIRISHPDRIIYPGTDITKLHLAEYYLAVADYLVPHIAHRPLSLVRCPEGIGEPCFFQRHIAYGHSPYLHDTGIEVKGRKETYMMIKDLQGLLSLVQWGAIELHPWGCLADKPLLPDRIIFDLDPDPALPWKYVIEAANEIRSRMQEFGLESYVKTTGGKGLHVTIPIKRKFGWPTIKAFTRAIAKSMEQDNPKRYIATASKAARTGKIFVDYLRNDHTSTAIAPFSARAREGAPVAVPLTWEELKTSLKPAAFTIHTVPERLQRLKSSPWEGYHHVKQALSARTLRALAIEIE